MATVDSLRHRGPTRYAETWMPMEEVLQRVAAQFPLAVIRAIGSKAESKKFFDAFHITKRAKDD